MSSQFPVDSILDEHFAKRKTLHEIGWCSSYMIDKRVLNLKKFYEKYKKSLDKMSCMASKSYLIEFSWLKISPNRKLYKKKAKSLPLFLYHYANVLAVNRCSNFFEVG